jgi:hypothetical protein
MSPRLAKLVERRYPKAALDVYDPQTMEERRAVAGRCEAALQYGIHTYVDEVDAPVSKAYAAWPTRLFLVGQDGRVAYRRGLGPFGFKPAELTGPSADGPGPQQPGGSVVQHAVLWHGRRSPLPVGPNLRPPATWHGRRTHSMSGATGARPPCGTCRATPDLEISGAGAPLPGTPGVNQAPVCSRFCSRSADDPRSIVCDSPWRFTLCVGNGDSIPAASSAACRALCTRWYIRRVSAYDSIHHRTR